MKVNPGGQLAPEDVVGREKLIEQIWRALEQQSLILSAERRMGKTSMIGKMKSQPNANWLMLYRDLESISSPAEFTQMVLADVHPYLTSGEKFKSWFEELIKTCGGAQVGSVKLPTIPEKDWKQVLQDTLRHVSENQSEMRVAFLWDELPMMLQKIGDKPAMEVLDTLRAIRQTHHNIRMVFTGSIGLHHVIKGLKDRGYTNSPVNDMRHIDVPPLQAPHDAKLVRALIKGEGLSLASNNLAEMIASNVDGIPYYIQHVVANLCIRGNSTITADVVELVIKEAIQQPQDTWHLKHYFERILTYYGKEGQKPILALLDALAAAEAPLLFPAIINQVSGQCPEFQEEQWRAWLDALIQDHYIARDDIGAYRFRFQLIRRWWRWNRSV